MWIETQRLVIRELKLEDAKIFVEMAADGSLNDIGFDDNCGGWMHDWITEAKQFATRNNPCKDYLAYVITLKNEDTITVIRMQKRLILFLNMIGVLNPIEIKKISNPGTELIKVFSLLDKSSAPRSKGAVICMKPGLGAIDRDNYIVPIWMI